MPVPEGVMKTTRMTEPHSGPHSAQAYRPFHWLTDRELAHRVLLCPTDTVAAEELAARMLLRMERH